jgi:phosphomethylpyrimidine synthase
MCGPHFCSMRISQDVRRYAADRGLAEDQALQAGLAEKAAEFNASAHQRYRGRTAENRTPLDPD